MSRMQSMHGKVHQRVLSLTVQHADDLKKGLGHVKALGNSGCVRDKYLLPLHVGDALEQVLE